MKKESIYEHFVNGFEIGFGIGCLMTFLVLWISLVFGSQLTLGVTYESIIAVFIYPLLFLIVIGTIFLTAGIVKHLHSRKEDSDSLPMKSPKKPPS
jgi:hypothetical protein